MICILKLNAANIDGWVIAPDIDEARRKMQGIDMELAGHLYRMFDPPRGRHELPGGYTMLVD